MRKRVTFLIAAAVVASTVFAAPAQAANAKKCDRQNDRQEIRCCVKKADSQQERNKCIKRNLD